MTDAKDMQSEANTHYASHFDDEMVALLARADAEDEDASLELDTYPLCVQLESVNVMRGECTWSILLGTGGPADRVLVTTDYEGNIDGTPTYQFQDWFQPWTE